MPPSQTHARSITSAGCRFSAPRLPIKTCITTWYENGVPSAGHRTSLQHLQQVATLLAPCKARQQWSSYDSRSVELSLTSTGARLSIPRIQVQETRRRRAPPVSSCETPGHAESLQTGAKLFGQPRPPARLTAHGERRTASMICLACPLTSRQVRTFVDAQQTGQTTADRQAIAANRTPMRQAVAASRSMRRAKISVVHRVARVSQQQHPARQPNRRLGSDRRICHRAGMSCRRRACRGVHKLAAPPIHSLFLV
ncbi:hypothetical protein IWX90DRAFT_284270 [Phyllosticta citrichinensis]|uniref:Uncharacterized protein n=1 Tax=Phyllosticta citrichinensis TaxID=1130410 RepID=A0ABR1XPA6_9PEZI